HSFSLFHSFISFIFPWKEQSFCVAGAEFQGTQTSCPAPAIPQVCNPTPPTLTLFLPALVSRSPLCLPKPNSHNTLFINFPSLQGSGIASLVSSLRIGFHPVLAKGIKAEL
uniref:Uncharacterized protein n=1 Tax=Taeniopygia guttata TaxID=59729 RepID=A0A674GXX9_TAEGU